MGVPIVGFSGVVAEVNADRELTVATSLDADTAGFSALACESDPGGVTGVRLVRQNDITRDYRLRVGTDGVLFLEPFMGAALNTGNWISSVTAMTAAVSGGYVKLNSAGVTTTSASARIQTYRAFPLVATFPLYFETSFVYVASSRAIANTTTEIGLFVASGITDPTDGVFVRWNTAGDIMCVTSYGGSETGSVTLNQANADVIAAFAPNVDHKLLIVLNTTGVEFWVDNMLMANIPRGNAAPSPVSTYALPISARVYNAASAPGSAVQLWLGQGLNMSRGDVSNAPPFSDALSMQGSGAYQGQSGGTMGQTANYTNSTEPVAATLSNTAAGYTTKDGQWSFAAPLGAVTDFCLFGFQVPLLAVGSVNKSLIIRGVRISMMNVGAPVATTATVLQWALGVGSTAVSLATADGAGSKAPRRVALGIRGFAIAAGIGQTVDDINVDFNAPLLVEPGSFAQLILRVPIGTNTALQVIRGTYYLDAQYDS